MASSSPVPVSALPVTQSLGFKRLRMIHRRAIALHLQGLTGREIDRRLGKGQGWTSALLRDDRVKALLEEAYKEYDQELRALTPKAIDTIRTHLDNPDGNVALRAADMVFKTQGTYQAVEQAKQTAEDVIERVLEHIDPDGTRTRVVERRAVISAVQNVDIPKSED